MLWRTSWQTTTENTSTEVKSANYIAFFFFTDKECEGEFGDLLFSLVNAARLYGINPDNALERTNRKFISRFNHIEKGAKDSGRHVSELTIDEMDKLWNEAKSKKN